MLISKCTKCHMIIFDEDLEDLICPYPGCNGEIDIIDDKTVGEDDDY